MYRLNFSLLFLLLLMGILFFISGCKQKQIFFPPVMDAQTRGYCGSCHMAFQASMLPTASWRLMMKTLDDHFKEQVQLKPETVKHIENYLAANAGDNKTSGEAGRIALQGLDKNADLQRITNTPYFIKEHRFLENRILDDWVGSLANCPACHVGAWVGDYIE